MTSRPSHRRAWALTLIGVIAALTLLTTRMTDNVTVLEGHTDAGE